MTICIGSLVEHFHEIILEIHTYQNAFVKRMSCEIGFVQENMKVTNNFHRIFSRFLAFRGSFSNRKTLWKGEEGFWRVYSHSTSWSFQQLLLIKNYIF